MNKFLKGLEYFFVINGLIYCLDLYLEEFTGSGLSFIKPLYTYSLMCVYIIFNSSFQNQKNHTDFKSYFTELRPFEIIICFYGISYIFLDLCS